MLLWHYKYVTADVTDFIFQLELSLLRPVVLDGHLASRILVAEIHGRHYGHDHERKNQSFVAILLARKHPSLALTSTVVDVACPRRRRSKRIRP